MTRSLQRIFAVIAARNLEFIRDRSALAWSVLMPFFLIIGFTFMFSDENKTLYKVGVIGDINQFESQEFFKLHYIEFIPYQNEEAAIAKVDRHQLDMLIESGAPPRFWVNTTSQNGYILEHLLASAPASTGYIKQAVSGSQIRYVDWVFPGILGLNIMFNCLFGVGYVIVRYRKSGFLKRLKATPLRPAEFLLAQMTSRFLLIQSITVIVFLVSEWILGLRMDGSYLALLFLSIAGSLCMISMGLIIAARIKSEELAGGLLNLITWPMMLLSGAWFSLEGASPWLQQIAQILPLTHLINGARAVMTEGASFITVMPEMLTLIILTFVFTLIGSLIFRWE